MDYIFNYKNNLTKNQLGFDTIEINLVIVFDPEVSEFLEEAHTDIWLNLNHATPIVGEDLQDNILAVNS